MIAFLCIVLVGVSYGQISLPGGHELHVLADEVFNAMDFSPKDGVISKSEFDDIMEYYDQNNDTCITEAEYITVTKLPAEVASPAYAYYDTNKDSCWSQIETDQMYHAMDHSGNGLVDMHEYEIYYQHLAKDVFGHGHGSHGGHTH